MTSKPTLETTFNPAAIEKKWYKHWEEQGLFRPERPDAAPFTIVNPPPNVTGSLHIGHALDNTLQDIIVRYERLRGKDALWVVGTDHAGIATQMVVERQLEEAGDRRSNYSREQFVDKVWEWKEESGGTITTQLRRLGCSMDWSREQFTMDPHFTKAVTKTFVDLYNNKDAEGNPDPLIYRDKRLVNWDPKLKTAISDLEVETREVKGEFWHFKYPLADGVTIEGGEFAGRDYIEVATTRPETMLADMAVAVHPEDTRYASVVGKYVELPITGRRVPIVKDEHADPELGSGAVKITPGHDFNDFEVGKRAGFVASEMLNMLDSEGNVCQTADNKVPEDFIGLHRFKRDGADGARELVVKGLKELGFLIPQISKTKKGEEVEKDSEPRTIATPFGDRGGVVIEPWLTDQWYVDAKKLAVAPMQAVRDGTVEITPKSWEKTFFHWMENIQPWCVSRQLWWGHRIPAWYGPHIGPGGIVSETQTVDSGEFSVGKDDDIVASSLIEAIESAIKHICEITTNSGCKIEHIQKFDNHAIVCTDRAGPNGTKRAYHIYEFGDGVPHVDSSGYEKQIFELKRDEDVLDTWFSSGLWPFATLGWPDTDAPLFQKHYPNDLLISGFDILFFWDARMMMQGMHLTGKAPWKRLYLHGLVRAADGAKMSKSKGNVVDPLGLIDQYGADALRFFMAAMESQGRDIKMDEKRVEGYRNFATKLWNATRFCQSNGIGGSPGVAPPPATLAANQWIIGEVQQTVDALDTALADLRFDAAANIIYHFAWDRFCDWYLELIKPVFAQDANEEGTGAEAATETREVAGWALDQILVMLHPFMPFVTEELWNAQGDVAGQSRAQHPIITAQWPAPQAQVSKQATDAIDWVIELTSAMRSAKNELGIPPGAKLPAFCPAPSDLAKRVVARSGAAIERVARLTPVTFAEPPQGAAMQVTAGEDIFIIPLDGVVDIAAEKARLEKAYAATVKEAKSLEGRLSNANFVERAKPEAVEKAKADFIHHSAEAERLKAALERLG